MRTLVIGDIHGGLRALHQILERSNVTTHDKLIFLGDYVDGWSQSPQVIDFLIEFQKTHDIICLRGNHDELLKDWLKDSKENEQWYQHGGESTVLAYHKINAETKKKHVRFLESLKDYYIDEKNRIFVHAGFTNLNGVNFEYFPKMFYWDRTLWETALALDPKIKPDQLYYPKRFTLYHEIYVGHTPVSRIGETTPVQKANVWNIDTSAAFKGPLTILDVDTKEFWQSEPLPSLYPNEKGRNKF
ncbi:metallophosphoesterase family protein [Flavobacterium sp.]|uniref:metallophosphoesterase family protein n=1 Tax=Flavobacterium sp. TaxID=239 RepID=UPI002BB98D75|nr:metallophosphoesterase family protein [Flavobacterium sp.]HSD07816.1 metallophosphoesterase family protein [Flavobacterium sp.]